MIDMRRRDFVTLLGGAAAWPLAARAQHTDRMRRIGVLMALAADDPDEQMRIGAFLQALQQLGLDPDRDPSGQGQSRAPSQRRRLKVRVCRSRCRTNPRRAAASLSPKATALRQGGNVLDLLVLACVGARDRGRDAASA
jgi:putative ABC transport system substrate-binding protein